jgi:hypothetical protein
VEEFLKMVDGAKDDPQLRGKFNQALRELDGTVLTFVEFIASQADRRVSERKNSTMGITLTDNLCKPS